MRARVARATSTAESSPDRTLSASVAAPNASIRSVMLDERGDGKAALRRAGSLGERFVVRHAGAYLVRAPGRGAKADVGGRRHARRGECLDLFDVPEVGLV